MIAQKTLDGQKAKPFPACNSICFECADSHSEDLGRWLAWQWSKTENYWRHFFGLSCASAQKKKKPCIIRVKCWFQQIASTFAFTCVRVWMINDPQNKIRLYANARASKTQRKRTLSMAYVGKRYRNLIVIFPLLRDHRHQCKVTQFRGQSNITCSRSWSTFIKQILFYERNPTGKAKRKAKKGGNSSGSRSSTTNRPNKIQTNVMNVYMRIGYTTGLTGVYMPQ